MSYSSFFPFSDFLATGWYASMAFRRSKSVGCEWWYVEYSQSEWGFERFEFINLINEVPS